MEQHIPKAVTASAKDLIDLYGENFKYLGKYKNQDTYLYQFADNTSTGFPFVYLYNCDKDSAIEITGFKALDIIQIILKSTKEDKPFN